MKYFKLIAKIFAVFALVFAIGLGALIWRLQHAPLNLEFLLSYLKTKDARLALGKLQLFCHCCNINLRTDGLLKHTKTAKHMKNSNKEIIQIT